MTATTSSQDQLREYAHQLKVSLRIYAFFALVCTASASVMWVAALSNKQVPVGAILFTCASVFLAVQTLECFARYARLLERAAGLTK